LRPRPTAAYSSRSRHETPESASSSGDRSRLHCLRRRYTASLPPMPRPRPRATGPLSLTKNTRRRRLARSRSCARSAGPTARHSHSSRPPVGPPTGELPRALGRCLGYCHGRRPAPRPGPREHIAAGLVFGDLLPTAIALLIVMPLKGRPVAGGGDVKRPADHASRCSHSGLFWARRRCRSPFLSARHSHSSSPGTASEGWWRSGCSRSPARIDPLALPPLRSDHVSVQEAIATPGHGERHGVQGAVPGAHGSGRRHRQSARDHQAGPARRPSRCRRAPAAIHRRGAPGPCPHHGRYRVSR
jgi:hypothetical protein